MDLRIATPCRQVFLCLRYSATYRDHMFVLNGPFAVVSGLPPRPEASPSAYPQV